MDEIAKFSILDEKFTSLDEIWTKNTQPIGVIVEKLSISFTFIGIIGLNNAFTVGLKERMPRITGMRMD